MHLAGYLLVLIVSSSFAAGVLGQTTVPATSTAAHKPPPTPPHVTDWPEVIRWLVEGGGFLLGVIALRIAIKHLSEIKSAIEENRATHDSVHTVIESLSTRYVGSYPTFLTKINDMLE
jgi:hypothetical protein